ncbi:MAG: molybdopterin oxidoreductase family protein [Verrucomicrobiales bacterium]
MPSPLHRLLSPVWRQHSGPFTSELAQGPARFNLGHLPQHRHPAHVVRSICGFCSTGCGLLVHQDHTGQPLGLTPDPDHPVNRGHACPKGWEALTPLAASDRAVTPLVAGRPVDWPTAAATFCDRFRTIQKRHGREAVAFLSTGQIMTEEMALLGAFAKFGMGLIHGDGNTRQCMATAVTAYKESFGFDAPPYSYSDFEESDVLVFIGANPCIAHPIMWQRVMRNPHRPEIIVIDPRATETAAAATQHLAIRPKTDLILFHALAHYLLRENAIDRTFITAHTRGFNAFAAFLADYTPENHLPILGLSADTFERAARTIARGRRVSYWWTMGVNQGHEAVRTAQAIINVVLMTGQIGRPGTGANSITGQCNAMGSRLFSNTTNLIGGHDFTNPLHRQKIADTLAIPVERIPTTPSWAYDQILDGIESGAIRGLWMVATNGAHSWIHQNRFRELARKLEFFVVQDMYATTESARLAHLVLPAAGWGEKEGTFINSERRLGVSRQVSRAPGQALSDFRIVRLLAEAWGCGNLFADWVSPAAVFHILKRCSRDQPCDISGIENFDMIENAGGIQWPWPNASNESSGQPDITRAADPPPAVVNTHATGRDRRLFSDGKFFTPDQRARFIFAPPSAPPESPDAQYPFVLLTGRGSSAQWHTGTRTDKSPVLRQLHPPDLAVQIHPVDAAQLGIKDGDSATIRSRRGALTARARVVATVQPGQLFLPMHDSRVNRLTAPVIDPHSRQPGYKYCTVSLEAARPGDS